jgi:hypothetical protein
MIHAGRAIEPARLGFICTRRKDGNLQKLLQPGWNRFRAGLGISIASQAAWAANSMRSLRINGIIHDFLTFGGRHSGGGIS